MDSQTAHNGQSVPSSESSLDEPDSRQRKKIPFGLALVIATFLIVGLLVISGYLWQFFHQDVTESNASQAPIVNNR